MKRQIIEIDEQKCTGCGDCIPNCPEGALQIIDGKARLVSDLFCDGLGACIGNCPEGAISTVEREAEPYDEAKVMENIIKAGHNTIKAHLKHLKDHQQTDYYTQAVEILRKKNIPVPAIENDWDCIHHGCPGMEARSIERAESADIVAGPLNSELRQWPVQLHLLNPQAPYLHNADLLISADCAPFAFADFHRKFLKGKIVINFCPKLDHGIDRYVEKLTEIFSTADIRSVTIIRMEVPCCGGIEKIVKYALDKAGKSMVVKIHVISIQGKLI
jgi:Pyruvate/2-oxoacid:ferredoxin oxidoreductase delta subunit